MRTAAIVSLLAALISLSHGFIQSPSRASVKSVSTRRQAGGRNKPKLLAPPSPWMARPILPLQRTHSVECFGFNLPPGKSNDNGLSDILVGVAWIVGLIVFFASPLGGLFFAAVNSVFALLFITPFILIVAFNTWQFFSTVQGNCPSCSAPIRVLKDGSPSICLNCGSVVQNDNGRIDFAPPMQISLNKRNPFSASLIVQRVQRKPTKYPPRLERINIEENRLSLMSMLKTWTRNKKIHDIMLQHETTQTSHATIYKQ